jgi:hypothetical protein
LVLVGINDLSVALAQADTFAAPPPLDSPGEWARQEGRAFAIVPGGLHQSSARYGEARGRDRLAVWQLAKRVRTAWRARSGGPRLAQDSRAEAVARWRSYRAAATRLREDLPDLSGPLKEYRRNLLRLVDSASAEGVPIALLTQPTFWTADLDSASLQRLWFGGVGIFQRAGSDTYFSVAALAQAMQAYNQELLEVCRLRRLLCLDLADSVPAQPAYFVDDTHFSEMASRRIGEVIADWLVPILVADTADESGPSV